MKRLVKAVVITSIALVVLKASLSVSASQGAKALCEREHISYNMVETVATYCDYDETQLVELFKGYMNDGVEAVDAIADIVNCNFDEALAILSASDAKDI
jgi:hypothetical protein